MWMPAKRFNRYEVIYDPIKAFVLVELSKGQHAKVDCDVWERIKHHCWHALWQKHSKSYCASTNFPVGHRRRRGLRMHRLILGLEFGDSRQGDHANHDTLDNRKFVNGKVNLRIATASENSCNQSMHSNNTSGHVGVLVTRNFRKSGLVDTYWKASITKEKKVYTSRFPYTCQGLQQAVEWRKQKTKELHGDFAYAEHIPPLS